MTVDPIAYAQALIDAGIPVVVCRPRSGWKPGDKESDVIPAAGWNTITAADCDLSTFRPGVDALAMVAGHGIDVVDIDVKCGGSPDDLPAFGYYGLHRTPSGGWHYFVRSTGYGKLSPLIVAGKPVGDYCGGTIHGGSRLLVYLPGSSRGKYPGLGYSVTHPVDVEVLMEAEPCDELVTVLIGAGGKTDTLPGASAATSTEVAAFLAEHSTRPDDFCPYGRAAIAGMIKDAAGAEHARGGRHGWAVRCSTRLVELMRAGCAWAGDYTELSDTLDRIKPEGGTDLDDVMRWALGNADGTVACNTHGEGGKGDGEPHDRGASGQPSTCKAPFSPEPITLAESEAVARKWLGDGYDLATWRACLAAVAVEAMDGDAPWLVIVSGSGNAKTETVSAAEGAGAVIVSTISSEGALLSATSRKDKSAHATGGLLRVLGDRGILVIKDVTSILSMGTETRLGVLAALREVADGVWVRTVGVDGGLTLAWEGRLVVLGAVTTAWDKHHSVVSAMGDRFLLLRSDSKIGRTKSGMQSLANTGQEAVMRAELRAAFGGVIAGVTWQPPIAPTGPIADTLLRVADLATYARTPAEHDFKGEVLDVHAPEAPTRLVKHLGQIVRGAIAVGLPEADAVALAVRIAGDSVPPQRLDVLAGIHAHPGASAWQLAKAIQRPRTSVDRTLQALHWLGLLEECSDELGPIGNNESWRYRVAPAVDVTALDALTNRVRKSQYPYSGPETDTEASRNA